LPIARDRARLVVQHAAIEQAFDELHLAADR
jgi:hypothetical protein